MAENRWLTQSVGKTGMMAKESQQMMETIPRLTLRGGSQQWQSVIGSTREESGLSPRAACTTGRAPTGATTARRKGP